MSFSQPVSSRLLSQAPDSLRSGSLLVVATGPYVCAMMSGEDFGKPDMGRVKFRNADSGAAYVISLMPSASAIGRQLPRWVASARRVGAATDPYIWMMTSGRVSGNPTAPGPIRG